jgi:hypothetical protein
MKKLILLSFVVSSSALAMQRLPPRLEDGVGTAIANLQNGAALGLQPQACNPTPPQSDCSGLRSEFSDNEYEGNHGQIFFGSGPFYISHLPLVGVPQHSFQAIYEVDFPDTPEGQRMKAQYLARPDQGFASFAPRMRWNYPVFNCGLDRPGQEIPGRIHQGQYERGGPLIGSTTLIVKRRIFFRNWMQNPLAEGRGPASPREAGEYVVFGEGEQYFAARVIDKVPGVDHIQPVPAETFRSQVGGADHACFRTSTTGDQIGFTRSQCADSSAPLPPPARQPLTAAFHDFYVETGDLEP